MERRHMWPLVASFFLFPFSQDNFFRLPPSDSVLCDCTLFHLIHITPSLMHSSVDLTLCHHVSIIYWAVLCVDSVVSSAHNVVLHILPVKDTEFLKESHLLPPRSRWCTTELEVTRIVWPHMKSHMQNVHTLSKILKIGNVYSIIRIRVLKKST